MTERFDFSRTAKDALSDAVWDCMTEHFSYEKIADVMSAINAINVFNRLTITTRKIPEDLKIKQAS